MRWWLKRERAFENVDMNSLKSKDLQLNGLQLPLSQISDCTDSTTGEKEVGRTGKGEGDGEMD